MSGLKPFWRYYGGKWRAAPRYPAPAYDTIVEPFAGAAGYSLRYPDRKVVLVEKYAVIAEMWRFLIGASAAEVRRIPLVDALGDLPGWVPEGARYLVGFALNAASTAPRNVLSAGLRKHRDEGRPHSGWSEAQRERVAAQIESIRHWQIIEGDYTAAPRVRATWFVDAPYDNAAGRHYVCSSSSIDFAALGRWCRERDGQVIACENDGADWLPFEPFATFKPGVNAAAGSREVIWHRAEPRQLSLEVA